MKKNIPLTNLGFVWALMMTALLADPSIASCQQAPSPLTNVIVSSKVTRDQGSNKFTYEFTVSNPFTNNLDVYAVEVFLTRAPSEQILPRDNLSNGPAYLHASSEHTFEHVPIVPVGLSGPHGWTYSLGETSGGEGFANWASPDAPTNIRPAMVMRGFSLVSYGLPGIRMVNVVPWVDPSFVPENLTSWEELNAFYSQFTFRTKTIGPVAPKINFVAIDFLNYLISLVHESYNLGWIKNSGVQQSLLAKLTSAKRQLEKPDNPSAKNLIGAFLNELNGIKCEDFSCPGNESVTSEAYGLLFFNGQYLYDRL